MAQSTLQDIRSKVRKVTGRSNATQITDAQIDNYVNTFYLYDLPESLRLLKLKDSYTFETLPNVDTYAFPSNNYVSIEPPAWADGYEITFSQNPQEFYRLWPSRMYIQQIGTGNGTAGPYTGTLTNVPVLRSENPSSDVSPIINVLFTANITDSTTSNAIDDGAGNFLAPAVGTINYVTGAYNVTFANPIPVGTAINSHTVPYVASRPLSMLFYQNQIVFRPVPDQAYVIKMVCYRVPSELLNANTSPELNEWWQLLAYGAALKIFADNGDMEQYAKYRPLMEEQLILMQRRTIKQITVARVNTIYSDTAVYPLGDLYPYI